MFNKFIAITPHDTNKIKPTSAIYVGGTGDVTVKSPHDDSTVTFKAVPVGSILDISTKRVMATATTATLLIALYEK